MRVAYARIRDLPEEELGLLPEAERGQQFGADRRRREFLSGRALLRRQLEAVTGIPAASHRIEIRAGGKPVCAGGPAISITHAGDWVACCTAESGSVGIDIESIDHDRHGSRIAERFFSPAESVWLAGQDPVAFVMLWVLKEASLKSAGKSIFGGMDSLSCTIEPPRINVLESRETIELLQLYAVEDFYLGLAASGIPSGPVTIECWSPVSSQFEAADAVRFVAAAD